MKDYSPEPRSRQNNDTKPFHFASRHICRTPVICYCDSEQERWSQLQVSLTRRDLGAPDPQSQIKPTSLGLFDGSVIPPPPTSSLHPETQWQEEKKKFWNNPPCCVQTWCLPITRHSSRQRLLAGPSEGWEYYFDSLLQTKVVSYAEIHLLWWLVGCEEAGIGVRLDLMRVELPSEQQIQRRLPVKRNESFFSKFPNKPHLRLLFRNTRTSWNVRFCRAAQSLNSK